MPASSAKTCRICSRPLTMHEQFAGNICSHWRCRWRALDAQLETHRNDAAIALGEPSAKSFPISVVPFHTRPTVPVSPEEREGLLAFLEKLREDVFSHEAATKTALSQANAEPTVDAEAPNASLATLLGKVCGVCEGFCCHHGAASHAFLDQQTLLRFLAEHPDMQAGGAVLAYLQHVPEEHYRGSCIYHTKTGCNLPRDMRARICNAYECRGLTDTREHFARTHANRMFVVVRHDNQIMRSAFVDESGARPYPTDITAPPSSERKERDGVDG